MFLNKFSYIVFFLSLLVFNLSFSQSTAITIDGIFDDWNSNLTTFTDTNEIVEGLNLLEIQVTNDEDFLFLKIKTDQEFDLTGDNPIIHNLILYLDTDNNTETGFKIRDDYGAELGIDFQQRIVYDNFENTTNSQIIFSDIRFRSAPTVTSNEFEIAIGRDIILDNQNSLFPSSSVNILFRNTENLDWLPNLNTVFTYTFDDTPVDEYTPVDFAKTDASFIRVMAYNTLFNGLLQSDRLDEYERIIKAVNPDIVGFLESYSTSTTYVKSLFDDWLPLNNTNGWYVAQHGGEVTVSKWEISQTWDDLTRQFPVLIDLPDSYGTDLLYTNAHLNCCTADEERQDQADQYAAFILDAKTDGGDITLPNNTPFIYSGDLNLVGLSQQLSTLKTGNIQDTQAYGSGAPLDWDNTDLKEENAIQSDIRMAYTWRSDTSSFPPGKLDFVIFSDYTLNSEKSFVIQTEVMDSNRLALYNLLSTDTTIASDHFPVITDFSINQEVLSIQEEIILSKKAYPNPTEGELNLSFIYKGLYTINIYNSALKNVFSTKVDTKDISLNIDSLASGLYLVSIKNSNGNNEVFKIMKK